ncbi:type I secretion system permease/ATPase [Limnohabitans sp. 103DPR2]|uniref:type I secretion system permease/ATPase n=1 Tax=Limnohabitans sp. 103DPR2 TaxID=1678129 RepID=UPI0006DC4CCB|nr:type I secretion system permease/ATPase [Limnohabitans sp. 103DPR2]ALK93215.1 Type I secretion system ATP-binding protein PrsD [Limnohabitans sp. 103DPR2]
MKPQTPPSELALAFEPLKPVILKAIGFSTLISLLALAPTVYMLEVYDRVVNSRSGMTLAMLTVMIVLAYAVMELLEKVRGALMRAAGVQVDEALSKRVYDAMFQGFLKRQVGGSMQVLNDLKSVREFLASPALMAVLEAPVALVALALIFAISPVLGYAAIVGAIAQILVAWMNERATRKPLGEANRSAIGAQQFAEASLRNAHVMESMGMLEAVHGRWQKRQREFLAFQATASSGAGLWTAMSKAVQQVMSSLLLGLGAWLMLNNMLNGGASMMIIGSVLGGRVLAPLSQLVAQWNSVVNVRGAWGRLEALLAQVPPKPEAMPLPAPKGYLTVEGLMAGAPGQQVPIVRGVQFALSPGEVLAVVGPSASGKTTLARLLVGLWPAMGGKVRLDGADIHTWDKTELGPYLGYLPQGVELLDGTLAENIARFGEVDMVQVEAAARLVGLHELIMSLPEGYNSPVGRDGAMLSGGQRQRVGLARALYGKPVFVVLDEPNSSLDEAGDLALANAIAALKQLGTTFVVMTHRTSVLGVADKMLIMRDGAQQAFGPRDEVLAALQQKAKS